MPSHPPPHYAPQHNIFFADISPAPTNPFFGIPAPIPGYRSLREPLKLIRYHQHTWVERSIQDTHLRMLPEIVAAANIRARAKLYHTFPYYLTSTTQLAQSAPAPSLRDQEAITDRVPAQGHSHLAICDHPLRKQLAPPPYIIANPALTTLYSASMAMYLFLCSTVPAPLATTTVYSMPLQ